MKFNVKLVQIINRLAFFTSFVALLAMIYDLGFEQPYGENLVLHKFYLYIVWIGALSLVVRYFHKKKRPVLKILPFDILLFIFLLFSAGLVQVTGLLQKIPLSSQFILLQIGVLIIFFREIVALRIDFKWTVVNPAQLFIISFFGLIALGYFFLLFPNATYNGISSIDALFTATSAVCVTGLTVVDTGKYFTPFGQIVIISLVQAGGLGIMTFASYFGYFFKGTSSFKKQLVLNELTWSGKLGEVFSTLKKIILITILIETLGAVLIFTSLSSDLFPELSGRIFFSVFHSISGFCNAGFSILEKSFYTTDLRFNYFLHLIVAVLFILGGLGFPIVFNLIKYIINKIIHGVFHLSGHKHKHVPWLLNFNTRLVILTTSVLIVGGTVLFFFFEFNNTLSEHSFIGKITTSFFSSVTPRTAGFNTIDTSELGVPATFMVLFLMWVGASPASTGGGIKTTTLTVAVLNFLSVAKGKKRLEIFGREVSQASVNRAFSVIFLSVLLISLSVFGIMLFDSEKNVFDVFFECVSAFSTVGLSRGITAYLSSSSKFILILAMFIGRIGMLTILIAMFRKVTRYRYRYPAEDVLIH